MQITEEYIHSALTAVMGDDAELVSAVTIKGARVGMMITVLPHEKEHGLRLKKICEEVVGKLEGVESVSVVVTAESPSTIDHRPSTTRAQWNLTPIEEVKKIIAVASGKGGVGKSTTTVNIAHALTAMGKKVGILDADIYGPSIPHMLGLPNVQPTIANDKMQPALAHGIKAMSIGLITGDEAAILRGPMISKSLTQMLRFTNWGELDVLLVDMPPGTGDIHLSMAQAVPMSGAMIVTTPQPVATIDAAKCAKMFLKVNVPLLGIIENMSGDMFGTGGGKKLADQFGVSLLGEVPLDSAIREASDKGNPSANSSYITIATQLCL